MIPEPKCFSPRRSRAFLLALAGLGSALSAQDRLPTADPPADAIGLLGDAAFRVPIHTAADDPVGGAYGVWASQNGYKVGFDGGITFHPALGRDRSAPWAWRTTSIVVGTDLLPARAARTRHDDWRFEYHHGTYVEAYDVRPEGVEQTFRFDALPGRGDLVIRGRVATGLRATPRPAGHAPVEFRDASGETVVSYGAATVFDAHGRSLPMATAVDGATIELRVPASWLAAASFPIIVDPLVQNVLVRQSGGFPIDVEIARDDESNELLLAYSRWIGDDIDGFALLLDDDYTNQTVIWSDITSNWKTEDIHAAFVGGADHWLMALTRRFNSTDCSLRLRNHPKGLRQFSPSVSRFSMPGLLDVWHPDVGGTAAFSTGTSGLVVFNTGNWISSWNAPNADAYGVLVDAVSLTAGAPFLLDASGSTTSNGRDRERQHPCVIPENGGGNDAWLVGWQEYDNTIANDDWDIQISKVSHDGVPTTARTVGQSQPSRHSLGPKLAGRDGRYLLGFAAKDNNFPSGLPAARQVYAQRINWGGALFPTVQPPRLVRERPTGVLFPMAISYDNVSRSHWIFVTQGQSPHQVVYADLLGHRAGVCQALTVSPVVADSDFSPAVTFDDDRRVYKVVYGGTHQQVRGDTITYFDAATSVYGAGCGAGQIAAIGVPDEGAEFFGIRLDGVPAGTSAFLNLAVGATSLPLATIGMPNCFALTSPSLYITTFARVTDVTGAEVLLPLPAPLQGNLFAQWVHLSPGANALGVEATAGLRIEVR